MLNVFKGMDKGYQESKVKKENEGFKRTYGALSFKNRTLSVV